MAAISTKMKEFMDNYEYEILGKPTKKKKENVVEEPDVVEERNDMSRVLNTKYVTYSTLPTLKGGYYRSLRDGVAYSIACGNKAYAVKLDHARLKFSNLGSVTRAYGRTYTNAYTKCVAWDSRTANKKQENQEKLFTQYEKRAFAMSAKLNEGKEILDNSTIGIHAIIRKQLADYMRTKTFTKHFTQQYEFISKPAPDDIYLCEHFTFFGKAVVEESIDKMTATELLYKINDLPDIEENPELEEFCCGTKITLVKCSARGASLSDFIDAKNNETSENNSSSSSSSNSNSSSNKVIHIYVACEFF